MRTGHKRTIAVFVSVPALAFGGVGLADAAKSGGSGSSGPPGPRPAELRGDTATRAKVAALEVVPGTAVRATDARAGGKDGAAYAVFVRATAGGRYVVLEDSAFKVVSKARDTRRGMGEGNRGPGGRGVPPPGGPK
jgi:hypothetical protein